MQTRRLIALTLFVLTLHMLLLGGLSLRADGAGAGLRPAGGPLVFSTRSIQATPVQTPSDAAAPAPLTATPPAAARKAPKKPPAPRPKPAPRTPAATPAETAETAQSPDTAAPLALADAALRAPASPAPAAEHADASSAATGTSAEGAPEPGAAAQSTAAAAPTASPALAPASAPASAASAASAAVSAAAEAPARAAQGASGAETRADAGLEIFAAEDDAKAARMNQTPPPVRIPPPMRLEFDAQGLVKGLHYTAGAQLLWQHDGSRYQARQEVRVFLLGTRAQTSTGSITAQGLRPERFGDIARRELAAHFDYAQGRVIFSANTPQAPLRAGAQDRLSVFIQLGAMFAAQPQRFVPGTRISVPTIGPRSADRWVFAVRALETLHLPAGDMPAWRLERLPERDYDQKAELWLSPDLGYLPVRIRLTQSSGDYVDLQLRSSGPP
ncbi:MAG: DUF3108 domain-containing protein [Burkholderiaceae bacterium]